MFKKKKNLDQLQSLSSDASVGGNPQQLVGFKGRRKLFTKKRLIVVVIILVIGFCAGGVVAWRYHHDSKKVPLNIPVPDYVGPRDSNGKVITDPAELRKLQKNIKYEHNANLKRI